MKYFAIFYQLSTGYIEGSIPPKFEDSARKPIEVCGDRGTIQLDGRLNTRNMRAIAADECKKRGFIGYKIISGKLSNPVRESGYYSVEQMTDLQTVGERINARNAK